MRITALEQAQYAERDGIDYQSKCLFNEAAAKYQDAAKIYAALGKVSKAQICFQLHESCQRQFEASLHKDN